MEGGVSKDKWCCFGTGVRETPCGDLMISNQSNDVRVVFNKQSLDQAEFNRATQQSLGQSLAAFMSDLNSKRWVAVRRGFYELKTKDRKYYQRYANRLDSENHKDLRVLERALFFYKNRYVKKNKHPNDEVRGN